MAARPECAKPDQNPQTTRSLSAEKYAENLAGYLNDAGHHAELREKNQIFLNSGENLLLKVTGTDSYRNGEEYAEVHIQDIQGRTAERTNVEALLERALEKSGGDPSDFLIP